MPRVDVHGTTARQVAATGTNDNGPEGPRHEGEKVGWLMGLEPTTTRITNRAQGAQIMQINGLRAPKKPRPT